MMFSYKMPLVAGGNLNELHCPIIWGLSDLGDRRGEWSGKRVWSR